MKIRDEEWLKEKQAVIDYYNLANSKAQKGGIVFAGSSLMYNFPIEAFAASLGLRVYNRGICGFEIYEYEKVLDICIFDLEPSEIYINIGSNDLGNPEYTLDECIDNYERLISKIEERLPYAKVVFIAYYPVNPNTKEELMKEQMKFRTRERIDAANKKIENMAKNHNHEFINLNEGITDSDGFLKREYSIDGVHISQEGYEKIFDSLSAILKNRR